MFQVWTYSVVVVCNPTGGNTQLACHIIAVFWLMSLFHLLAQHAQYTVP